VFVLGIILQWFVGTEAIIIGITAAFMFVLVVAIFVIGLVAVNYELNEQGLTTRNIFFKKKIVPYDKVIAVKESVNIVNRPKTWTAPLSVVGIQIDYYKENGNKSWFFISPKDRQEFIEFLQNRITN